MCLVPQKASGERNDDGGGGGRGTRLTQAHQ